MVITLPPRLEAILVARANERGVTPEALAAEALASRFDPLPPLVPRDEWERRILSIGETTSVPVTDPAARNRALSSEGLYD